jgi:NDP-sugar pyrophosphorylase family protein
VPHIEHAVIAAAGIGSRLGHGIPKCLVEVGGETLIAKQLDLLSGVPDVRVVIGYQEGAVIDRIRASRAEVTFVRNARFRETTTQDSYALGAEGLTGSCLFMDADIFFDAQSFHEFTRFAATQTLAIGVTAAKTDNAVFANTRVSVDGKLEVVSFTADPEPFEWANIVYAPASAFFQGRGAVFETLDALLPAPAKEIVSYEIDTEADLERAQEFALTAGSLRPII